MTDIFTERSQRSYDRPNPDTCKHRVWAVVAEDETGRTGVCSTCLHEKHFPGNRLKDFSASDDWYVR